MKKHQVKPSIQARIHYKTNHPLYGENREYDSWMTLCEVTLGLAEEEAGRQLYDTLVNLRDEIANEMIESVEEYEPKDEPPPI